MTSRERLLASFDKKPVDRMPVAPFIHMNFVKEYFGDPKVDLIPATMEVYRHFGFDLMLRNVSVRYEEPALDAPEWRVTVTEKREGKTLTSTTTVKTPERELRQVEKFEELSPFHLVKATTESFIKEREDFEQFQKYQPPVPQLGLEELKRARSLIGDEGIIAPWFGGLFNYVSYHRPLENLLMDALGEPEFYEALMEYFLDRLKDHASQITAVGVDVLSYPGNIANGTMVGPDFFREFVMPYERQLIEHVHSGGTHVLYHNCGDARNMIEVYNDFGIHAFESMTEPPYANNDLADAVARFAPHMTLIGNLDQIDFLRKATPEEVRRKVAEKLEIINDRPGFIFGTSDFLEENTPHENLKAIADAAIGR